MTFAIRTPKNTIYNEDRTKATSLVTTIGALYKNNLSTGVLELAVQTATQSEKLWLANEAIAAADAKVAVNCALLSVEDEFVVDSVNNSNVAHNGQRMILGTTGVTVNNTGTDVTGDTGVFTQIGVVGAAADKKIRVRLTI